MSKLTTKQRKAIPSSEFAGPDRSYPINDRSHGAAAKSRAAQFASPSLKARIDAKVDAKYPGMGGSGSRKVSPPSPPKSGRGKR